MKKKKLLNFVQVTFLSSVLDEMFIKVTLFKEAFPALTNYWLSACLVKLHDEVYLSASVHKIKVFICKYIPGYFKENLGPHLNAHY